MTHNAGTRASGLARLEVNVRGTAIFLAAQPSSFLHVGTLSCLHAQRKVPLVNKSFQTPPETGWQSYMFFAASIQPRRAFASVCVA